MNIKYDSSIFVDAHKIRRRPVEAVVFRFKRMMPDYVFETVKLEGNPLTFPEVQTLLDGITVGGRKLSDLQQVLNQRDSCLRLMEMLAVGQFQSGNMSQWIELNAIVAKDEALKVGCLRDDMFRINGTDSLPPEHEDLLYMFEQGAEAIENIENPVERAYAYSAWAAYNHFFFDGNKRTGRLVMNGILLSNGYDALTIAAANQLEYNTSCLELYNTGDASRLFRMMLARHLEISNPKRGIGM